MNQLTPRQKTLLKLCAAVALLLATQIYQRGLVQGLVATVVLLAIFVPVCGILRLVYVQRENAKRRRFQLAAQAARDAVTDMRRTNERLQEALRSKYRL
jgi:hypothetical protein